MNGQDLFRRASRVTPGGVHSPVRSLAAVGREPIFMQSAAGAELRDTNGRGYVDFCMAFGPLILGHSPAPVTAAAVSAVRRGASLGTAEPYSLALAELIRARLDWAEHMRFVNSGTEAVMTALRIARAATGRSRILKFDGCYHGHVDAMLMRAGSGLAGTAVADSAGVPPGVAADTLIAPLDDEDRLAAVFSAHKDIAAVIIEPLPANYGLLPQRREFLQRLRELCSASGSLLIFDEVITGFRVAFGGCTELLGVQPDLVTWGKIIGGGFPVGAVAGGQSLMAELAPTGKVYQAGTLSANPVAMAAGRAALEALLDGEVYAYLEELGGSLDEELWGVKDLRLQRVGSLFWMAPGNAGLIRSPAAIPDDTATRFARLFGAAVAAGLYLPPSPFEVGFLSRAHAGEHIRRLAAVVAASY